MTLGYVVFHRGKALTVYQDQGQAEWCRFLLGRHAVIKRFTSKTLMELLTRSTR